MKVGRNAVFAKVGVMTVPFVKGRYGVRFAQTSDDIAACKALRHLCFFGADGLDEDRYDQFCQHLMVAGDAGLICTLRLQVFDAAQGFERSYTAQSYDLEPLLQVGGALLEVGRFCVAPDVDNHDVLRLVWGALAEIVDEHDVQIVFGCVSFDGTDEGAYHRGFSLLGARYQGGHLAPRRKAAEVFLIQDRDLRGGAAELPSLLRSYLAMGGWVSDHGVVDHALNTLHVFTAVEVAKIPPARSQALRNMIA